MISERQNNLSRFILFLIFVMLIISGACTRNEAPKEAGLSAAEQKYGIKILSLMPTAAGHMLDLRYRVIDPEKAVEILNKDKRAFVVDKDSGKTLPVPQTRLGPLRQSTLKPEPDRIYFMLFSNRGGYVKEGSNVKLVIGDFVMEEIIVQGVNTKPLTEKSESTIARKVGTEQKKE